MKKSKAIVEIGGTKTVEGFEFYIGFFGLVTYHENDEILTFPHSYTAYSTNFCDQIFLAGFCVNPVGGFNYRAICAHFAREVGEQMKKKGITAYELVNGNPETGIVFDTRINQFAYYRNAGAKMDPIPKDGIEWFKRTLEEYLQE